MHSITHIYTTSSKKNIVLRIIAIVLSFEVDGDVSLIIINVSISAEKLTSVRLFPFQYFSRWLNNGAVTWLEIPSDTFSNSF